MDPSSVKRRLTCILAADAAGYSKQMGQDEDGMPQYHGDADLVSLLAEVPVDRMPWKAYPLP